MNVKVGEEADLDQEVGAIKENNTEDIRNNY